MAVILGIDPGSRKCGYGLIKTQGSRIEYLASGVIRVEKLEFPQRLHTIFMTIGELIAEYQPDMAAIEEVFVGKSGVSALKLGHARGAAMVACTNAGIPVSEYAARRVKLAVVGSGNADKTQVQHMIKNLLKLTELPKEDAADALSVSVCHAHTQYTLIRMSGVRSSRHGRLIN